MKQSDIMLGILAMLQCFAISTSATDDRKMVREAVAIAVNKIMIFRHIVFGGALISKIFCHIDMAGHHPFLDF